MAYFLWACEIGFVYLVSSLVVAVIVGRFLRSATLDPELFAGTEPPVEALPRYRFATPLEARSCSELSASLQVAARTMHEI